MEFSPVEGGDKSDGGGRKAQDEGFHLKVSVNLVACLEKDIFSFKLNYQSVLKKF